MPFHIFAHEKDFQEYERDDEKLNLLLNEYKMIIARLDELVDSGKIDEYAKCTLEDMANKVASHLTQRYSKIQKGVSSIMRGKILDYEAKTILRRGIAEGRREGELNMLFKLVRNNKLSPNDASTMINMSLDEFNNRMGLLS